MNIPKTKDQVRRENTRKGKPERSGIKVVHPVKNKKAEKMAARKEERSEAESINMMLHFLPTGHST